MLNKQGARVVGDSANCLFGLRAKSHVCIIICLFVENDGERWLKLKVIFFPCCTKFVMIQLKERLSEKLLLNERYLLSDLKTTCFLF